MNKRPKVSLPNHTAMFEYYRTSRQRPHLARAVYASMRRLMDTRVSYDTPHTAKTLEHAALDPVLLVSNHPTNTHDQFHLAAAIHQSPLRSKIGSIAVCAKMELFNGPPPARTVVDGVGGLPTVRSADYASLPETDQPATRQAVHAAYTDMCAEALVRGDSLHIFPEGTRTKNGEQLSTLRKGFAYIAQAAVQRTGEPLLIAPIGISYPNSSTFRSRRHADVTFLAPYIATPDHSVADIASRAEATLQLHLDGHAR